MKREMLRHKSRKVLFIENRYKVTIYCTVYSRYTRTVTLPLLLENLCPAASRRQSGAQPHDQVAPSQSRSPGLWAQMAPPPPLPGRQNIHPPFATANPNHCRLAGSRKNNKSTSSFLAPLPLNGQGYSLSHQIGF